MRPLSFSTLLALGVNGVVGVGIFFVPRAVAEHVPGARGLLVYAAVLAACAPVAWVYATLGQRFDRDGGPFVWARAAFGDAVGFAVGWIAYVSAVLSTASVVVGLVEATFPAGTQLGAPASRAVIAAAIITAIAAVLSAGLRLSAAVWTTVTIAKLAPLGLLLAAYALAPGAAPVAHAAAPPSSAEWFAAGLPVLFALQGFEIVPLPAGQVRGSAFAVPAATLGSLALAGALYLGLHAACVHALPGLASTDLPLAAAATALGGASLGRVVALATSVSALGIAIGMVAMTPRYLAAIGGAGGLGGRLDELSERAVPLRAFAVTWVVVVAIAALATLYGSLGQLFAMSSVAVIVQYAVTAAALARLAWRREHGLAPRDAWPAPLAAVACALLARGASALELGVVAAMIACGLAVRRARAAAKVAA